MIDDNFAGLVKYKRIAGMADIKFHELERQFAQILFLGADEDHADYFAVMKKRFIAGYIPVINDISAPEIMLRCHDTLGDS